LTKRIKSFGKSSNRGEGPSLAAAYVRMSTDLQKYSTENQLHTIRVGNDNTIAWAVAGCSCRRAGSGPTSTRRGAGSRLSDSIVSVFLGPHRLARFAADGQQISPDAPQPGSVLGAVKDKPLRARKRASLTAPARAAVEIARVGAKKRPSSRTKKQTRGANPAPISMA
jgi:hypothetical protein